LSWLFWSDFDTNPFGAKAIYVVFRLWGWEVAANYSPRPKTHTNTQPTNQPTKQLKMCAPNARIVFLQKDEKGSGIRGSSPHALGWALVMAGWLWLDWLLRCCWCCLHKCNFMFGPKKLPAKRSS